MPVTYIIEYADGQDVHKTILSVSDPAVMARALKSDAIKGKKNEELAIALAEALRGTAPLIVERYKNGERHDARDGTPATETFDANGQIAMWKRFNEGRLHDADGEPAMVVFADGGFSYAASFKFGAKQKTLTPQECTEAYWAWGKKHAKAAPDGNIAPGVAYGKPV